MGCWNPFAPKESDDKTPNFSYLEPTTPENVLQNLILSYRNRDIDMYLTCFSNDGEHPFEFHLLENDWQDLNNDGIKDRYWGLETEELFTRNMFERAKDIQIDDFRGNVQYVDSHDAEQLVLVRAFNLIVWMDDNLGLTAHGEAEFTFRQDDKGIWHIVKWIDRSMVY